MARPREFYPLLHLNLAKAHIIGCASIIETPHKMSSPLVEIKKEHNSVDFLPKHHKYENENSPPAGSFRSLTELAVIRDSKYPVSNARGIELRYPSRQGRRQDRPPKRALPPRQ